jgi:hypothetical protein
MKEWTKTDDQNFSLVENGTVICQLNSAFNNRHAVAQVAGKNYDIECGGVFSMNIKISDSQNKDTVLKLAPVNWYSSTYSLWFNNRQYSMQVRNTPTVEYVIQAEDTDYLSYALRPKRNESPIDISEKNNEVPAIFHVALWYMFAPIVLENLEDAMWWSMRL